MKKVIWTLNVNNYAPDITAITYPLISHWAWKIGAEFRIIRNRKWPDYAPVYEKLQIHKLGEEFDWNIYIDSDAIVHPEFWDPTEHIWPDTVLHNGNDFAPNRWRPDRYFRRDARWISSCNWFTVASNWCLDLWRPLDDISYEQAVANISPNVNETNTIITAEHLIDDYTLSRNIARFGLHYTTLQALHEKLGDRGNYLWHNYTITEEKKLEAIQKLVKEWKLEKFL